MISTKTFLLHLMFFVFASGAAQPRAQENNSARQQLSAQQQSIVIISALTATGDTGELKGQMNTAMDAGLTINEVKEILVQLYAYCGFPRSLNAISIFMTVLEERKSRGIADRQGKDIVVKNNRNDKYEQGRKVLETLTKTAQPKPAPGFGEFVPKIDVFLKEHLFADIFESDVLNYQQRELVTIAALAAMQGVGAQLQSHINTGRNMGISVDQLAQTGELVEKYIGKTQANSLRKLIGKPYVPVVESDIMVRIAEIEIIPEFLEHYKSILKEEAAASLKIEPGVIAIFPMYQQKNISQVKIVEIYATKAAYQSHLQTPHFLRYKSSTHDMVKSLKLVEMESIDKEMMLEIFKKLK